ncbi:MAG: HdeD family acid-resistance protein [Rhodothalassiaceae bacterium]
MADATDTLAAQAPVPDLAAREILEHKSFFWIAGGLSILIGVVAILLPFAASLAASLMVGALFAAAGIIQCVTAFRARRASRIAWGFFIGLVGLAAGAILLAFPLSGVVALTLFLAAYFIVSGLMKLIFAFRARPAGGWGWMIAGGLASLLLGFLIWAGLPSSAFWVLGLLVGIDLMLYGAALIALVTAAKRAVRRGEGRPLQEAA